MPIIHEGWTKVEYSTELKVLYVSGKGGVILRIEGITLPDEYTNISMLDVKVDTSTVAVICGASVVTPGAPPK